MKLTPEVYWELRARMLEGEQMAITAQRLLRDRECLTLIRAGLEPHKRYRLDDTTLTATEIEPEGAKIDGDAKRVPKDE